MAFPISYFILIMEGEGGGLERQVEEKQKQVLLLIKTQLSLFKLSLQIQSLGYKLWGKF